MHNHVVITAAVAGASGYAGGELLRLLSAHPDIEVTVAAAHGNAGQQVGDVHPHLRTLADLDLVPTTPAAFAGVDLVFLALPHGASGEFAAQLPAGIKIVDLGADHRLLDAAVYERYYGGTHPGTWTYGLPELPGQRAKIAQTSRVANTGCYAVAITSALAPLVAAGIADPSDVVVVAASGTSGAGRGAKVNLLGSEVMGDVSGYKVGAHQHVPEIKQASGATSLSMTPFLAPMPRGILAAVTVRPAAGPGDGRRCAVCACGCLRRRVVRAPASRGPAASHGGDVRVQLGAPTGICRHRLGPDHRYQCYRQPRQRCCRTSGSECQHHVRSR